MPITPVPALALPELISRARSGTSECRDRWFLASVTGAAQKAFWVNVAAHAVFSSKTITTRSSLSSLLMPAATDASFIPATGNILSAVKFCLLIDYQLIYYRRLVYLNCATTDSPHKQQKTATKILISLMLTCRDTV
jgi:hypothetical protein